MYSARLRAFLIVALITAAAFSEASPESRSMMVQWTGGQLEYTISLSKSSFLVYEPILAELWVKNPSADTVTIVTFSRTEEWVVQDQSGKYYRPRRRYDAIPLEKKIMPNDSFGGVTKLNTYGGGVDSNQSYPYPFLPVGEYALRYRVDSNSTASIKFNVVEPMGEEKQAVKLFLDAYSPTHGEAYSQANDEERDSRYAESTKRLIAFADSFPSSVYDAEALADAERTAWNILGDGELAYRLNKRLIREYGDPFMSGVGFFDLYYLDTKKDTVGFRVEVDSLIRQSDNPKLIQTARRKLKELKEKSRNREKAVPTMPFLGE